MSESRRAGLPFEVAAVWLLFAVVLAFVFTTYARLGPGELYHVSGSGLDGGASRVLVLLNFPIALAAIAVLIVLAERQRGRLAAVGVAGIVLCAAVFWPGMVDQGDLDAKPANTIAALGVATAVVLSVLAWRSGGIDRTGRCAGDRLRLLLAVVTVLLAVPWVLADLGVSLDGVPVLGTIYQTGELRTQPGDPVAHPAVHSGHHHGLDGALLILTALVLSRLLWSMRATWVRGVAGAYLALMLCYGAAVLANDFWLEQVVKRGWTSWEAPNVLEPTLSIAWGALVVGATALWALVAWHSRRVPSRS